MTEPIDPIDTEAVEGRETEDLRPVPGGEPGVYWTAMRIALVLVAALIIGFFVWLALSR
jgi:hypothetical protein